MDAFLQFFGFGKGFDHFGFAVFTDFRAVSAFDEDAAELFAAVDAGVDFGLKREGKSFL